jgi:hypothetical protein
MQGLGAVLQEGWETMWCEGVGSKLGCSGWAAPETLALAPDCVTAAPSIWK